MAPGIVPGYLAGNLERAFQAGQSELNVPRPGVVMPLWHLYRHAAFAQVGAGGFLTESGDSIVYRQLDLNGHAGVPATFALHESAGCPKTGFRALGRNGLVQDKMGSHIECRAESVVSIHDGDG